MIDIEVFVDVVKRFMTKEKLNEMLQYISDCSDNGNCILCDREDVPVDEAGNEIEGDDVSKAFEWQERHTDDCPVTLLIQTFRVCEKRHHEQF